MNNLSLIVAVSNNSCIGKDNTLPWRQREDLLFFKRTTLDKAIIMGRKTFESIGNKPLPRRLNIVISDRLSDEECEGIIVANGIKHAVEIAQEHGLEPVIIGGASVYEQCINDITELYMTVIDTEVDGDAFFPTLNMMDWDGEIVQTGEADEKNQFNYTMHKLVRKNM